jgi:hypothetical protein
MRMPCAVRMEKHRLARDSSETMRSFLPRSTPRLPRTPVIRLTRPAHAAISRKSVRTYAVIRDSYSSAGRTICQVCA